MSDSKPAVPPAVGLGLGLLAVSTASLFIRYAQADGTPSLVIAAWRLSLATLILLPWVAGRHSAELRRLTAREWSLVAASGIFLGLHFGTWISSLAYTSVANSVVFVSTAPLFVALIAAGLLRERLNRWVVLGLAVALAGSIVVGVSDAGPALADFVRGEGFLGDLLALAGAVTVAIYLVIGRSVRARLSLPVYIFLTYGGAALTLLAGVGLLGAGDPAFGPAAFPAALAAGLQGWLSGRAAGAGGWALWVLLLALVPQLIGHSAYNWALRYLPATFVSVTVLGEPLGSILLAALLLNETPSPLKLLGAGLILAGILSASRRPAAPAQPPEKS
ncbi:MAG: DMT family transporter [Anaerolineales bacterium]|nr:DMT family transporter [Anaerolineales bacterium]